jgi:Secretion system C-terminal sorting domain
MRKVLFIFVLALGWQMQSMYAQCVRDSSLLTNPNQIISPPPTVPGVTPDSMPDACIGSLYRLSMTIEVPATFVISGTSVPLVNASIATTNAISNLPPGLSYTCDPPNTLGCVLISGTPTPNAMIKTYEPTLSASVNIGVPVPITFPSAQLAPGKYYLEVKAAGTCVSGTRDLNEQIETVMNTPNPFSQQTTIQVTSKVEGAFEFEVFNLVGRRIHRQSIRLVQGDNAFTFDAGDMSNGVYFYTIGNKSGKVARRMVVQR